MGVVVRGVRNAYRNSVRTFSIVFILGISIAMSLVMLLALKTVDSKISSVKSSVGNIITVTPAGVRGFEGGGDLLTTQNATDIASINNVSSATQTLTDRVSATGQTSTNSSEGTSSLTSAIEPGSFGRRQQGTQSQTQSGNTSTSNRSFSMPIMINATNNLDILASLNVSQFNLTSGSKFDINTSDNVALLGTALATKNNLNVNSTFQAYGKDIKVVGIYDTGTQFTNGSFILPLKTLQTLSGQNDQINSIIVQSSSVDNVLSVAQAIKDKLGDKADVTTAQDASQSTITPLENIKTISLYSLIGSLVAGSVIILLTMVMIVRERRREIGVLKAIGSSNLGVMGQFIVEAMTLTFSGAIFGIILGIIFSNPILKVLVTNSQTSSVPAGRGGGVGQMMRFGVGGVQNTFSNLHAVVGWEIILYGLLAAAVIAIIGSAIPAFFISKIRPAEVMRAE